MMSLPTYFYDLSSSHVDSKARSFLEIKKTDGQSNDEAYQVTIFRIVEHTLKLGNNELDYKEHLVITNKIFEHPFIHYYFCIRP